MNKFLSITADDFGPHPFINQGIINGIENNKIDSVGVLSNVYKEGSNFSNEIKNLVETIGDKKVGIGVHLSISSGAPLVPSKFLFLENGLFQNIKTFDFGVGKCHLEAIYYELEAQILRLQSELEKYGEKIDHISSHQGLISLFSPYNKELVKVLLKHKIKTTVRNPLPISKEKHLKKGFKNSLMKREGKRSAFGLIDENINHLGKLIKGVKRKKLIKKANSFRKIGCHVPNHFFDNYYGKPNANELNKVFKHFQNTVFRNHGELVVHLGQGDNADLELNGINTKYFPTREKELNILNQYDFSFLETGNVKRIPMGGEYIPINSILV